MIGMLNPLALPRGVRSASFNPENTGGEKGAAAKAASVLGAGRKGAAWGRLPAGGSLTLVDTEGPGVIRHIWITVARGTKSNPFTLRNIVLKAWWDDSEEPSISVPLGDFFCLGSAEPARVESLPIVVAPAIGLNSYLQMPFRTRARIVIESQHPDDINEVFYQVDATLGDDVGEDAGYLHADWRRTNATAALGEDHVILDGVHGRGAFVGSFISVTSLERYWWGEGEVKFFLDGDDEYPSQTSTGLEDYAGGSWAFQDELRKIPEPTIEEFCSHSFGLSKAQFKDTTLESGFIRAMPPRFDMYRWHFLDPILFERDIRVTLQQIGCWDHGLFERSDDISSVAYWYQDRPIGVGKHLGSAASRRPR